MIDRVRGGRAPRDRIAHASSPLQHVARGGEQNTEEVTHGSEAKTGHEHMCSGEEGREGGGGRGREGKKEKRERGRSEREREKECVAGERL